jgi:hypothetical protein
VSSGGALCTAFACVFLTAAPLALATLGGDASSIDADRTHIKAQTGRSTPGASYTVQELDLPSGTVVHEYLSAAGKVFAVTWQGPSVPDLRTLLGDYFQPFVAGAAAGHHDHHHVAVTQPDLVVRSGGHMRDFAGRAYVPSLLPPGFSPHDLN